MNTEQLTDEVTRLEKLIDRQEVVIVKLVNLLVSAGTITTPMQDHLLEILQYGYWPKDDLRR